MGYYTRDGFKKLRNSLEESKINYEKCLKRLGEVEKENNLAESTEFIQERFKVTYTYNAERRKIIENLNNAIIIEDTEEFKCWDGQTVSRKCEVTIDYDGIEFTYKILGENETDFDNDIISCSAPIVLSMLGHKAGDFIDFNGNTIFIKNIKSIENELTESDEVTVVKGLRP